MLLNVVGLSDECCDVYPTPGYRNPGYRSVVFFMDRSPTDEETEVLMSRAHSFCKNNDIVIEGFRLLRRKTTEHRIKSWICKE